MKVEKKDLIDFLESELKIEFANDVRTWFQIKSAIKSFNSQASIETRNVNDNKEKDKVCDICGSSNIEDHSTISYYCEDCCEWF